MGSYQESPAQAYRSAARVLAARGAAGVKLEGGCAMAATIGFLVERGVPVLGHVGLQPKAVDATGFRAQGRTAGEAPAIFRCAGGGRGRRLRRRRRRHGRAGGAALTAAIPIPTIGIGALPACDGQILVSEDMLGLFGAFKPRLVKRYADFAPLVA